MVLQSSALHYNQTETLFQGYRLVTQQAVYAIAVLTYTGGQCGAGGRYIAMTRLNL